MSNENYINHIALVLDASGSMGGRERELVKVTDNQIAYLAQRSKELDQETRVTVYTFDTQVKCLIYDKDVLRMPSIEKLYKLGGSTALIKATLKSIEDLEKTATLYGDHSFLIYVLTDGQENASGIKPDVLEQRIKKLPDNWTLATFVPDAIGVMEAKRFGFLKENIAVWDATSVKGVIEAGETIKKATENFMQARAQGVRSVKNLFNLDTSNLSQHTAQTTLGRLHGGQFRLYNVEDREVIAPFVEKKTQRPYKRGEAYYQLVKPEKVQPTKSVALFDPKDHAVYIGANARKLLGLPDHEIKVNPATNTNFEIFIQSDSVNRILPQGSKLLLLS